MHADLYDYDGTICPGDTGTAFWLYCLVRRPYILLFLPIQIVAVILYMRDARSVFARHASVYCFLRAVNSEKLVQRFAERRVRKTYPYFTQRERTKPVVVCSASPEFLLRPICDRLGVGIVIGTDVDPRTGVIRGKRCKGEEKVRRLREALPDAAFDSVYSDSLRHDAFILRLGARAYHVVNGQPKEIRL